MAERFGSARDRMAMRIALTAFVCWLVAFACITWGQVRVLRAQRYSQNAGLQYTSTLVRAKTAELRRLNRELDFHTQVLRSSYPRVFKTSQAKQPFNVPSHRRHGPEIAEIALHSPQAAQPAASLSPPTP
jgi:hypothetical protein